MRITLINTDFADSSLRVIVFCILVM